ncbi:hypothetical protein B0J11DRAFT_23154 [Dendryphion nanum]|uniref:Uncharacterized protein n=1 Tax=Dendryphion nanum TaxID=256645 RepID=A0A9P9EJA5_9PLEO|nr:hypothetical protein B0J11DRAFT_23154 [Dendryphion nanum]
MGKTCPFRWSFHRVYFPPSQASFTGPADNSIMSEPQHGPQTARSAVGPSQQQMIPPSADSLSQSMSSMSITTPLPGMSQAPSNTGGYQSAPAASQSYPFSYPNQQAAYSPTPSGLVQQPPQATNPQSSFANPTQQAVLAQQSQQSWGGLNHVPSVQGALGPAGLHAPQYQASIQSGVQPYPQNGTQGYQNNLQFQQPPRPVAMNNTSSAGDQLSQGMKAAGEWTNSMFKDLKQSFKTATGPPPQQPTNQHHTQAQGQFAQQPAFNAQHTQQMPNPSYPPQQHAAPVQQSFATGQPSYHHVQSPVQPNMQQHIQQFNQQPISQNIPQSMQQNHQQQQVTHLEFQQPLQQILVPGQQAVASQNMAQGQQLQVQYSLTPGQQTQGHQNFASGQQPQVQQSQQAAPSPYFAQPFQQTPITTPANVSPDTKVGYQIPTTLPPTPQATPISQVPPVVGINSMNPYTNLPPSAPQTPNDALPTVSSQYAANGQNRQYNNQTQVPHQGYAQPNPMLPQPNGQTTTVPQQYMQPSQMNGQFNGQVQSAPQQYATPGQPNSRVSGMPQQNGNPMNVQYNSQAQTFHHQPYNPHGPSQGTVPGAVPAGVAAAGAAGYAQKMTAGLGKATKATGKFFTSSKGKKLALGAGGLLVAGFIGAEIGDAFSGDCGDFGGGDMGGGEAGGGDMSGGGGEYGGGETGGGGEEYGGGEAGGGGGGGEMTVEQYNQEMALMDQQYQSEMALMDQQMAMQNQMNQASLNGAIGISVAAGNSYTYI